MRQFLSNLTEFIIGPLSRNLNSCLLKHICIDHNSVFIQFCRQSIWFSVHIICFRHITKILFIAEVVLRHQIREIQCHGALCPFCQLADSISHVKIHAGTRQKVGFQLQVSGIIIYKTLILYLDAFVLVCFIKVVAYFLRTAFCRDSAPHPKSNGVICLYRRSNRQGGQDTGSCHSKGYHFLHSHFVSSFFLSVFLMNPV